MGMSNQSSIASRRCQAMIVAMISNPESQQGIDFCVGSCPYDRCVAVESNGIHTGTYATMATKSANMLKTQAMLIDGVTPIKIAIKLGLRRQTIYRYQSQMRSGSNGR